MRKSKKSKLGKIEQKVLVNFYVLNKGEIKMFNKVVIVGNLTKDIEMRFSQGGAGIANSAIATTRKFKARDGSQSEETLFIDITFFGRTAEIAQQYLHKGSKVLLEGRLKFDQWTDQNGQKRSKHSVRVESMQMLDSKNASFHEEKPSSQKSNEEKIYLPQEDENPFEMIDDKDMPF